MKTIKHWEVNIDNSDGTIERNFKCTVEPDRITDYYKLVTIDSETVHLMVKDLSYISWKPVFEEDKKEV